MRLPLFCLVAGASAYALREVDDCVELAAADFEATVLREQHVYVVEFYSALCSACRAFRRDWDAVRRRVDGLHWGKIDVDNAENRALALRMGVLEQGVPNVKLFNAAAEPSDVVRGDTPDAETLEKLIREALAGAGTELSASGYYQRARVEL